MSKPYLETKTLAVFKVGGKFIGQEVYGNEPLHKAILELIEAKMREGYTPLYNDIIMGAVVFKKPVKKRGVG